jgi:hypothetical protein
MPPVRIDGVRGPGRRVVTTLLLVTALGCGEDPAAGSAATTSAGGHPAAGGNGGAGGQAGAGGGNPASCGSPPTGASLDLAATFESISVKAAFTDLSADDSTTIRFREEGGEWRDAYPPFVDLRTTVSGSPNPYLGQARGSIVGLTAGTSYEVCVTITDAEGNSGGLSETVTTLSYVPPTGGATITVTNDSELATALDTVEAGQTIHLEAGSYGPFTIARSGTADAWIVVEGDGIGSTFVSGSGVEQNISIEASFIVLRNLELDDSDASGVVTSGTNIFIQDVRMQNVSAACAGGPAGHYGDAGVSIGGDDTYVLRTTILSPTLSASCTLDPPWDSPGLGIAFANDPLSNIVLEDDVITGGFRDAVGTFGSAPGMENVDVSGLTISGHKDDGIELDSTTVNVREWSNVVTVDAGDSCFSAQPGAIGPLYVFRNACRVTTSQTAGLTIYKLGGEASGSFFFHNSTDSSPSPNGWDGFACGAIAAVARNNIVRNSGSALYNCGSAQSFDYDLYQETAGFDVVASWNGSTNYTTVAEWNAATGQESNGLEADPAFTDAALHITATSPAHDAAVVLPNFNDESSAWPAVGAAPDIGWYEIP